MMIFRFQDRSDELQRKLNHKTDLEVENNKNIRNVMIGVRFCPQFICIFYLLKCFSV